MNISRQELAYEAIADRFCATPVEQFFTFKLRHNERADLQSMESSQHLKSAE